jgi:Tetrapyrrole (Corrin/Porphyrin) Methylases
VAAAMTERKRSLRTFLARLAVDPEELTRYLRDPRRTMQRMRLDEAGQRALLTASAGAMWNLLLDRPQEPDTATETDMVTPQRGGSLVIVGTGIRTVGHLTTEAIAWVKAADSVLYLVADPVAEEAIRELNPQSAMSLRGYYGEGVMRTQAYEAMVEHIMSCVRAGQRTCAAFYGHPGVFAYPSHESIRRARAEGYPARMLPGVSAEDCLFADLGVDPAVNGCLSIEASDFLLHDRVIDTSSALVLWQVGVVGDWTYRAEGYKLDALPMLVEKLVALYGAAHESFIYEAATLPGLPPRITPIAVTHISPVYVNAGSTLYIPPLRPKALNRQIATALGFIR